MSVELTVVPAQQPAEFKGVFAILHRGHVQALYLLDDPFFASHAADVLDRAAKARIPVMAAQRRWVREGALLSYSVDFADMFRRSAFYVDKILKGAKPGDLPVEQPTKFELVVNLKTAKRLGLILTRTEQVIRGSSVAFRRSHRALRPARVVAKRGGCHVHIRRQRAAHTHRPRHRYG